MAAEARFTINDIVDATFQRASREPRAECTSNTHSGGMFSIYDVSLRDITRGITYAVAIRDENRIFFGKISLVDFEMFLK